jgi:A/G-specific adenine glycosylase
MGGSTAEATCLPKSIGPANRGSSRRGILRAVTEAPALAADIARRLAPWFEREQRDLSWRRTRDPYAIWVSEIMLQQTRVETVERYYGEFLRRFPNVGTLAAADEDAVLGAWSGLGYYRRARLLHRGARYVADELRGHMPNDASALRKIPGVGRYTAGAIASIAFDRPEPLVDGNVARVLSRVCAVDEPAQQGADAEPHWLLAAEILRHGSPRVLAQALMELGATICTPRSPRCLLCPLRDPCRARAQGKQELIPAPRKKVDQPLEVHAAIAVVSRKKLMLVRRPAEGLLAGMWCLPLVRCDASGRPDPRALAELVGGSVEPTMGPMVRHVFTHRIWELHPARVELPRRPKLAAPTAWIADGQRPEGGLPSVTAKLLRALGYSTGV